MHCHETLHHSLEQCLIQTSDAFNETTRIPRITRSSSIMRTVKNVHLYTIPRVHRCSMPSTLTGRNLYLHHHLLPYTSRRSKSSCRPCLQSSEFHTDVSSARTTELSLSSSRIGSPHNLLTSTRNESPAGVSLHVDSADVKTSPYGLPPAPPLVSLHFPGPVIGHK